MSMIIAGGFHDVIGAESAVRRLQESGVPLEYICTFRVNPAGEHHRLALGGDHDSSPGAHHAHSGAAKGAAIGAAVGLAAGVAATPLLGPAGVAAGAGVGAYTGSLVGSLKRIEGESDAERFDVRPAENLVAVDVDDSGCGEEAIVRCFEECGARQIERAEGVWSDGCWSDFDATLPPQVIGGLDSRPRVEPQVRPAP